jgi:ribosomal protein S13
MYYRFIGQKVFFFGGSLFYVNQTLPSLLLHMPGFAKKTHKLLVQRFELTLLVQTPLELIPKYENNTSKVIIKPLNVILSQINTVNNQRKDLLRLIIMRMYLIRTYRGKCHAIGKPVRGQRT